MSKIDISRPDSRPTLLQRWGHFWVNTVGDTGLLGFGLRWGVLLLFAAYFFIPLLWLVLATSKSAPQLLDLRPLAGDAALVVRTRSVLPSWRLKVQPGNGSCTCRGSARPQ